MRSVARLAASIIITQAAGALGALATAPAIPGWYRGLEKPGFNPPAWVFGPAWTLLYLLMGIALFLVWQQPRPDGKNIAIAAFGAQLALNIAWSYIFFGLKAPGLAFVEIVVLWAAIFLTLILFRRVSRLAGVLLVPYIAWVTFAAALTYAIWALN